jgi:hypothetical protein
LTQHVYDRNKAFQVKQEQLESIAILLQISDWQLSSGEKSTLRKEINKVAPDLRVNVEYVSQIPLTRSGKRCFVIGLSAISCYAKERHMDHEKKSKPSLE